MAFHPFHTFRKHQKVLFAGLTILCMFVFILQFGAGDLFSRMTGGKGGAGRGDKPVATLYGREITHRQLIELKTQRETVNKFMQFAAFNSRFNAIERVKEVVSTWDEPAKSQIQQSLLQNWQFLLGSSGSPRLLQGLQQQLGIILAHAKNKEEGELVRNVLRWVFADPAVARLVGGRELYFGGGTKPEDLLDFLIWEHEADRLGIQLSQPEAKELLARSTNRLLTTEQFKSYVKTEYRQGGSGAVDSLLSALATEYRVSLAKEAMLGDAPSQDAANWSSAPTPFSFWKFFKDQTTEIDVELLPIPTDLAEFKKKVGTPKPEELRQTYEFFKSLEYDPTAKDSGFKQPLQIQVEWVKADPAHHRQQAEKAAKVIRAVSMLAAGAAASVDAAPAAGAAAAAIPAAFDLRLLSEYDKAASRLSFGSESSPSLQLPSWTDPFLTLPMYAGLNRPENVAATLGQAAGSLATRGSALSAAVAYQAGPVAAEAKELQPFLVRVLEERIEDERQVFLDAAASALRAASGTGAPWTTAARLYYNGQKEKFLPYEVVLKRLKERELDEMARDSVQHSLTELQNELTALSKLQSAVEMRQYLSANDPTTLASTVGQLLGAAGTGRTLLGPCVGLEANEIVRETARETAERILAGTGPLQPFAALARERAWHLVVLKDALEISIRRLGLREGSSDEFRDRFNIAADKGLQPLKEGLNIPSIKGEESSRQFANLLFGQGSQGSTVSLYSPERSLPFLYWRTAEKAPFIPPFEAVKDKVELHWYLEKARPLAKVEAEKLAEEVRKAGEAKAFKDARLRFGKDIVRLNNVARLASPKDQLVPVVSQSAFSQYFPYRIPDGTLDNPPPDLAEDLLKALHKKGDAIVVNDQPRATFYVAALMRDPGPPTENAFYQAYRNRPPNLIDRLQQEDRFGDEYRTAFMEELRKRAGLKVDAEALKSLSRNNRDDDT